MAQQNIDFGSFPDDPDADPIRVAFTKVQNNFDEIYAGLTGSSVLSVNRTPGAGVTVSSPTGNVIVSANIACVQVSTSTLSIGRGGNGSKTATITQGSQTLVVDIDPGNVRSNNFSAANGGLALFNGTLTSNSNSQPNVTSLGNLVRANITGSLIANSINSNTYVSAAYFVGDGANLSNVYVPANYTIQNGTSNVYTHLNSNVTISVNGNSNVVVFSELGSNLNGYLTTTGNVTAPNANLGNVVTANYFAGSGNLLSNIQGANVSGEVATANYATSANTANTVTVNAQPNITSVGTLTSLSVTGNATAGNVYANSGTVGANLLTGTVTTNAQPNITSLGTLTSLSVTGSISGANIIGEGGNLSNIQGANVTGVVSNASHSSTANTIVDNAQPNITSVGTLTTLSVSGNIGAGNINGGNLVFANFFQGDGGLLSNVQVAAGSYILNGNSNVTVHANANVGISAEGVANVFEVSGSGAKVNGALIVTGNANVGNIGGTGAGFITLAGSLTSSSQPNITSLGNLTQLISSGNVNFSNASNVTLGNVDNVHIYGGSTTTVLGTDGTGNLSWISYTGAPPGGANTEIQFNDGGAYSGNSGFTFDKITGNLSVPGSLIVASDVYANAGTIKGNLLTGTLTTNSQPNINGLGVLVSLVVSGNTTTGNLYANSGAVYANSIVANHVSGNGNSLFSIAGSNVTGTVANATFATSAGSANTAAQVTANAQPNVTSLGTLTNLNVSGNIVSANITANTGVISGNGSGLTSINASNISSGTLAQARLANSSLTVNGTSISLGGTGTITANTTQTLTVGSYLTGSNFNGGTATTWAVDATSAATGGKVVARDANGSFSANIVTATLSGSATSATTAGTVTTNAQPNITSVGTLTSVSVSGNASVGNLISSGFVRGALLSDGGVTEGGQITLGWVNVTGLTGQANSTWNMDVDPANNYRVFYQNSSGTTGIAITAYSANGNIATNSIISNGTIGGTSATLFGTTLTTGANTTAGTITGNWTLSTGSRMQATYADLAENYYADVDAKPGDVVVFGGSKEITFTTTTHDHRVAGIISTDPAYLMNATDDTNYKAVALTGRVPCKVLGPLEKGDLLVTSEHPGIAQKLDNTQWVPGCVIGKALETAPNGVTIIEVAVGRF